MSLTYSGYYLHGDACGLQEEGHQVNKQHVNVLKEAADNLPCTAEVKASGCNSCYFPETEAWLFWIAQGTNPSLMHVKYGTEDLEMDVLYDAVRQAAEKLDVPVSIPKDDAYSIVLGTKSYYAELEPGRRVRHTDGYRTKYGVVFDGKMLMTPETPHVVKAPTGEFGRMEIVARFADVDAAKEFAQSDEDYRVRTEWDKTAGYGDTLVLFEGDSRPTQMSTYKLEPVDGE